MEEIENEAEATRKVYEGVEKEKGKRKRRD